MDYNQLFEQIKAKKSFLCVGLDSDIAKIPPHLLQLEDPVFEFNKAVISLLFHCHRDYDTRCTFSRQPPNRAE